MSFVITNDPRTQLVPINLAGETVSYEGIQGTVEPVDELTGTVVEVEELDGVVRDDDD